MPEDSNAWEFRLRTRKAFSDLALVSATFMRRLSLKKPMMPLKFALTHE